MLRRQIAVSVFAHDWCFFLLRRSWTAVNCGFDVRQSKLEQTDMAPKLVRFQITFLKARRHSVTSSEDLTKTIFLCGSSVSQRQNFSTSRHHPSLCFWKVFAFGTQFPCTLRQYKRHMSQRWLEEGAATLISIWHLRLNERTSLQGPMHPQNPQLDANFSVCAQSYSEAVDGEAEEKLSRAGELTRAVTGWDSDEKRSSPSKQNLYNSLRWVSNSFVTMSFIRFPQKKCRDLKVLKNQNFMGQKHKLVTKLQELRFLSFLVNFIKILQHSFLAKHFFSHAAGRVLADTENFGSESCSWLWNINFKTIETAWKCWLDVATKHCCQTTATDHCVKNERKTTFVHLATKLGPASVCCWSFL